MMRLYHLMLLVMLSVDGGASDGGVALVALDGGSSASGRIVLAGPDAGVGEVSPSNWRADSGTGVLKPVASGGFHWPEQVRTLSTLDGPAVIAANAALQHLLARLAKQGLSGSCGYSAKAMEVVVGEGDGLYIVLINQRMDKCGWVVPPGFSTDTDWFEQYAVSLEGKILAHYPDAVESQ
jgi:hypothetical protein